MPKRDMTVSFPRGHLWCHALPILLGNWLQLAYNAADAMIAGRFIGRDALVVDGAAAPLIASSDHLMLQFTILLVQQ